MDCWDGPVVAAEIPARMAPCEDCGGVVTVEPKPVGSEYDSVGFLPGHMEQLVEFCTNLDCHRNRLRGQPRVDVDLYISAVCGAELSIPISVILASAERTNMPLSARSCRVELVGRARPSPGQ